MSTFLPTFVVVVVLICRQQEKDEWSMPNEKHDPPSVGTCFLCVCPKTLPPMLFLLFPYNIIPETKTKSFVRDSVSVVPFFFLNIE